MKIVKEITTTYEDRVALNAVIQMAKNISEHCDEACDECVFCGICQAEATDAFEVIEEILKRV